MAAEKRGRGRPPKLTVVEALDDNDAPQEAAAFEAIVSDEPESERSNLIDGWKERIKKAFTTDADVDDAPRGRGRPSKASKRDMSKELFDQLVPVLCLVVVWGVAAILPQGYEEVGPNQQEAMAIIAPPCRMIARRVKASGKVSEDTLDLVLMLTALTLYADRGLRTARAINATRKAEANGAGEQRGHNNTATFDRFSQPGDTDDRRESQPDGRHDALTDAEQELERLRRDAGYPTDGYAELLRADALGRRRLGVG